MKLSIVTPCWNEVGNVENCAAEVARVMREELPEYEYEHLFCDNASTDGTVDKLRAIAAADSHVKVILNSRNIGPVRNVANGLKNVSGDIVVPMVPADLQDPPSVIPRLVAELQDDIDVVYGIRANRKEGPLLTAGRAVYYWLVRVGGGATPPAHAGEFMLARKDIIQAVNATNDPYPYVRGLVAQLRPRARAVKYDWARRDVGKSGNSFGSLVDQAMNGLVSTAKTPTRWAMFAGVLFAVVGIVTAIVNFISFLIGGPEVEQGIPTLIVGMFFFGGLQVLLLGIIGEYVLGILAAVRPEPPMVERERINF